MSAHGRLLPCKPGHASRARERCARGVINPGLLEPASWARQQNDRRKGRKPRILKKWGPFRRRREAAETRRKLAEPPAGLCSRNRPQFCCLTQGVHYTTSLAEIAEISFCRLRS